MRRSPQALTAAAVLLAAVAVVWGPLLWAPFVYDDGLFVVANPDMAGPWPGLRYWLGASFGGYRVFEPVNAALHWALWALAGPRPLVFRATSLLLHWLDAALVFALLRRRLDDGRAALAGALLFAVFPAHAETLAVSTFKKHLLVSFFGLSMLAFVQPSARDIPRSCVGAALLALALLTKESALALPLLAGAADAGPGWRARLREKKAFWLLQGATVAAFLAWRLLGLPVGARPLVGDSWPVHLLTSAKGFLWYWRAALVPWPLCPESDLKPVAGALEAAGVSCALAGLCLVIARLWKRDRVAAGGLIWFALALAPFQNVPPSLNLSLVSDRYLYLASAGAILAALKLLWRSRRGPALLAGIGAAWAALSVRQAALYASPEDLWRCAADCAPGNPRSHSALGGVLAAEGRLDEAEAELRRSLDMSPPWYGATAALLLADVEARRGRLAEAVALAERVVETNPTQRSLAELGVLRLRAGDARGAERPLERALELDSRQGEALLSLGLLRKSQGRLEEAGGLWRRALAVPPYRGRAACELGRLALERRAPAEAEGFFAQALEVDAYDLVAADGLAAALAAQGRRADALAIYDALARRLEDARAKLPEGAVEARASVDASLARVASARRRR